MPFLGLFFPLAPLTPENLSASPLVTSHTLLLSSYVFSKLYRHNIESSFNIIISLY